MNPNQQTFDPTIVALMHGLKMQEGGGKINYNAIGDNGTAAGAGQWSNQINGRVVPLQQGQVPINFQNQAKQYGLDPLDFSPENQNKVLYTNIYAQKQQGMSPEQILSSHNSGDPNKYLSSSAKGIGQVGNYDVASYVKNAMSYAQKYAAQNNIPGQSGVAYASDGNQSQPSQQPSVGGFINNAVNSTGNLLGGLGNAIMHPIDTATNLLSTAAGAGESALNATGLTNINNQDTENFGNLVDYFGKRYGGSSPSEIIHNIGHTLYTDPVGAALDLSTFLDGVGGALGVAGKVSDVAKAGEIAKTADFISTTAGMLKGGSPEAIKALQTPGTLTKIADAVKMAGDYTNPIVQGGNVAGSIIKPITSGANTFIKSAISHATGFDTDTVANIVKYPEEFSKAAQDATSRGSVVEDVTNGLNKLQNAYSETGKSYKDVLSNTKTVTLPENFLSDILNKGTIDETGKAVPLGYKLVPKEGGGFTVQAGTDAKFYDARSVTTIQNFVDRWGNKTELTPDEFMNMRQEAAKMGKLGREIGENKAAGLLGRQIQGELNKTVRPQIKGLSEVDATAKEQITLLNKARKDIFNADGTLKDNATVKVANALNKNQLLDRLEKISPGITHKIEILKSVEDIERSLGIKVGNYGRSVGEIFGAATGNLPLIVGMIMSHPTVATQILRGFGYTGKAAIPILGRVRALIGALPKDLINAAVINNQATSNHAGSKVTPVSKQ